MTSSWFLRQGALQAIFYDGFWMSNYDFMIVIHSNFSLRCMVSEITRFYCKPDMTSSWFRHEGTLHAFFHDGFWKSDHDFLIVIHSNCLSAMHGFRFNEVLFLAWYDVIMIPPPGGASAIFHDGLWMSDQYFLIEINSNFYLRCMASEITRFYCKADMTSSWFLR